MARRTTAPTIGGKLGELYPEFPFFYGKNYGDFVVFSLINSGENMEILCAIHNCGEIMEKP